MAYSNTIPPEMVPRIREGARAAMAAAGSELVEADRKVFVERHRREPEFAKPADRWKALTELLDLILRAGSVEAVELDPDGHQLYAVGVALEHYERDHPGEGTAEIEAFCRDVGLRIEWGGGS
jgi:hypothetical protein